MKSRELIRRLQEADPTGELDVVVGNIPIYFISNEPAYYDGPLQRLVQDDTCKFYNIVGGEITTAGSKIQVHLMSIKDVLLDHPHLPVKIVGPDHHQERYGQIVARWRREVQEIVRVVEEELGQRGKYDI